MISMMCLACILGANVFNDTFEEGNAAYEAADYATAIENYEQLIAESVHSSAVFYNLGNAYYRSGHIGPAIANYERTLQLEPGFENARENLDKAVRETKHRLAPPLPSEWEQSLLFWHYNLPLRVTSVLAALFWFAFWAILGIRQWRPLRYTRRAAVVVIILAVAFGGSALAKWRPEMIAVANDEQAPVHYGTNENEMVHFKLYAGDRVTVDKRQNGWARVTTIDGKRGWAQEKSLTLVGPPYERPVLPEPALLDDALGAAPSIAEGSP